MLYIKRSITLMGTLFFIIGCGTPPAPVAKVKIVKKPVYVAHVPQRTHKNIKLKEVQDDNFSSDYMYPKTKKKKEKISVSSTVTTAEATPLSQEMSKDECVSMIGQEKFDKYTQMLGDESAAIKRCKILKSM